MARLWEIFFGCWHKNYSFPLSRVEGKRCQPYVVCLDCGREFPYDFEAMRVLDRRVA